MAIAKNRLSIPRDRYDALRIDLKRIREELNAWLAELQASLPHDESMSSPAFDNTVNSADCLLEAIECVGAADQWATGMVHEVKVKELW